MSKLILITPYGQTVLSIIISGKIIPIIITKYNNLLVAALVLE